MASRGIEIPWKDIRKYHKTVEQNAPKVSGFPGYRLASDRWAWVAEEDPHGTGYNRLRGAVWTGWRYLGNVVIMGKLSILMPVLDRPPEQTEKAPGIEKVFSYGSYLGSPLLFTYTHPRNDINVEEPPEKGEHRMVTREQLIMPTELDIEEFLACMRIGASGQNRVAE